MTRHLLQYLNYLYMWHFPSLQQAQQTHLALLSFSSSTTHNTTTWLPVVCTDELTFNVNVDKLWKAAVCDDHILFPKIMPEFFASAECVGNGEAGSTKIFHYTSAVKEASFVKQHLKVLDHANHILKYKATEGAQIGKTLKSSVYCVKFEASGADSCIVKLKIEYDTLGDEPLDVVKRMKEGTISMLKAAEGYLIANPSAYA